MTTQMQPHVTITEITNVLTPFFAGITKCIGLMGGSGFALFIAQALSEEHWIIKAASAVTGWALAVIMLYVLMRTVKTLFEKMEQMRQEHKAELAKKDEIIAELHETAVSKAESQRLDMLNELKKFNERKQ